MNIAKSARLILSVGMLTVLALSLYVAQRCYRAESRCFVDQNHPIDHNIAVQALGPVEDVDVELDGFRLKGVYAPSKNSAAVVLCHGSAGDRNGLLAEARALHEVGFGVLLFDFPGHGESGGSVHWSSSEVRAVRRLLDFLATRSDVDARRVGVLGFSMGGYITILAGAEDQRLAAVAAVAAPSDAREHTLLEHKRFTWIGQQAALLALKHNGVQLEPTPRQQIASIAPRSLLLVGSEVDGVVPSGMVRELYAAAHEPKQLVMVEGARHGDYAAVPGSRYLEMLVQFFERTLIS